MVNVPVFDAERLAAALTAHSVLIYSVLIVLFAAGELVLARPGLGATEAGWRNVVNFALWLLGVGLLALLPLEALAAAGIAQTRGLGLFNQVDAPVAVILLLALLMHTLLSYWLHRAFHAVPLLWRIHRVHHSDTALDLSTGLRHHPLEALLTAPFYFALIVALGLPPWVALLTTFILFAGTLFKHLDIALPPQVERVLGTVIATPALHRYHHSDHQPETDSNFGNTLIVWDRLFGTLHPVTAQGPARIGLGERHDAVAARLGWQLRLPLQEPPEKSP